MAITDKTLVALVTAAGMAFSGMGNIGSYKLMSWRVEQLEERAKERDAKFDEKVKLQDEEHQRAAEVEHRTDLRLQRIEDSQARIEKALDELGDQLRKGVHR